jgi:hypothetical protein
VFGQEQILGSAPIEKLLRYSLSLPVSLASVGMPRPEHIAANAELARTFRPMTDAERKALGDSIASGVKVAHRMFLADHADA